MPPFAKDAPPAPTAPLAPLTPGARDRLRVATWNCFGVPSGLVGWFTGTPHNPQRFDARQIARALAPYDVVCVQECFLRAVSDCFLEVADLLDMHLWHDRMLPEVVARSVFGGGLAILAREPLDVRFEMFNVRPSGFDALAAKGYATCELHTRSGSSFRVVNLHLQSDDPKHMPHLFGPARAAQIAAMLEGQARSAVRPTIVCGDLNVPEGSDEYHQVLVPSMRASGFVDVAEGLELHTYAPARNHFLASLDPHAEGARIDYIWTCDGEGRSFRAVAPPELLLAEPLGESIVPPVFASDHFGIGVELELA